MYAPTLDDTPVPAIDLEPELAGLEAELLIVIDEFDTWTIGELAVMWLSSYCVADSDPNSDIPKEPERVDPDA